MSWMLVALIPGLLMLATFGLDRVEASLRRDAISATDVAEFLDLAGTGDVDALPRDGTDGALNGLQRRLTERDRATDGLVDHVPAADPPTHQHFPSHQYVPTRQYFDGGANPEFQQTRHANRV